MLTVDRSRAGDLLALVRAADPGGRLAMAVLTYDGGLQQTVRLVGADTTRLASVPYWRADLSGPAVAEVARSLRSQAGAGPLPAVVAEDVERSGDALTGVGLDGEEQPLRVATPTAFLPRYGPRAALVDLEALQARARGPLSGVRAEVWLAQGAGGVVRRLAAAGIRVDDTELAATRGDRFGRQSPSLALLLFRAGAGVAALLALGGTVLELYLLGRRRAFEIAAMTAVGLGRRQLVVGVLVEQALVLGSGVAAGIGSGLLAVRLTLPVVPEFTDRPVFPRIVLAPDLASVSAGIAVVAAVLAAGVVCSALLLVRSATPDRLRESQP